MTRTWLAIGLGLVGSAVAFACSSSATEAAADGGQDASAADSGGSGDDAGDTDAESDFDVGTPDPGPCVRTPPSGTCGLDPNCGCGTATCDLDRATDSGAVKCVKAGTAILGRACGTTSDCISGLTCQFGACRPFCTRADAGDKCAAVGANVCYDGKSGANDKVCGIQCDLRDPTACGGIDGGAGGSSEGCAFRESTGGTDCYPVGKSTTTCTAVTDCAPGYWCIQPGTCQRWCRVGQDAVDCTAGGKTRCVTFSPTITVGVDTYGTCQ